MTMEQATAPRLYSAGAGAANQTPAGRSRHLPPSAWAHLFRYGGRTTPST
ncbi:hypothetical protein M8494_27885 [Serratia ureilytica]